MNPDTEISNASYPLIRLFEVDKKISLEPLSDCKGRWVECSPQTVGDFSAVAYYFGRTLHKELKQPVGLIHSSWGGTIIEAWISSEKLQSKPGLISHKVLADQHLPQNIDNRNLPSSLFNAMIAPVIPYGIKGVIWYQGESNADNWNLYRQLFPILIADWREKWNIGDFPFFFAQIANFNIGNHWEKDSWAFLRESQLLTLENVTNTGMVVTIDIGDSNDIHPKNKQEVGRRMALNALAKSYGKNVEYSGPIYNSMKIKSGKAYLRFDHAAGLNSKNGELKGFTIAGTNQKFVPAVAIIKEDIVVVESPQVQEPQSVRYAWSDNPEGCNLFNAAGLPASPFRTDNWPVQTLEN